MRASKAHRNSTALNYQSKWKRFRAWCHKQGFTSSAASSTRVARFLLYLRDVRKLSVPAIKGYRSALSSVYKFSGVNITDDIVISDLVSAFEKEIPRKGISVPKWDLDVVLRYLRSASYEPIKDLPILRLTQKTVFLLALATAKRVGELQALSGSVGKKSRSLVLSYRQDFLAKTETPSNPLPRTFEVPSLADLVGRDEDDRLLCPVRAVRCYRKMTDSPSRPDYLFLSPSNQSRPMTKNGLSYLIRSVIWEAHQHLQDSDLLREDVRAHDIRGISTSLNFLRNKSIAKVLEAATWKGNSIFASNYLKDVKITYNRLSSLGPLVAAGSIL